MTARYVTHDPPEPECMAPDIDIPDWFQINDGESITCGTCKGLLVLKTRQV